VSDIRERLIQAFQIEHRDYLAGIRAFLDAADAPGAPQPPAGIDEAFRQAHSLKGAARAVGLGGVEVLVDRLETLFDRVRREGAVLTADGIRLARAALDAVEDAASQLTGGRAAADPAPLVGMMDAHLAGRPTGAPVTTPAAPAAGIKVSGAPAPSADPARTGTGTLRVDATHLDRIMETAGELIGESGRWEQSAVDMRDLYHRLEAAEEDWRTLRRKLTVEGTGGPVVERVDRHFRALRAMGRRLHVAGNRSARAARQLGGSLKEELGEARMVQVEAVFGTTRRQAREIAADLGVAAEVTVTGLDLRADRMVLQRLKDPVMHLVRNALSHGIEAPAERAAKGKAEHGRVDLAFRIEAGRLTVSIRDDGRGLDLAAIRAAVYRHRLLPEGAPSPDDDALLRLIFRPGFTTRETVTDISGRGMGLSVVWEAAHRLGGTVRAATAPGGGAEFRITVPVSATAQTVLLIEVDGQVFGVPSDGIARLESVKPGAVTLLEGRPAVRLGGRTMPLSSFAGALGLDGSKVQTTRSAVSIVVLRGESGRVAFACDRFLGLRQGLVRDLGHPVPAHGAVAGGMVLDDGTIALVLNSFALLGATDRRNELTLTERQEERRAPVVLVVDDSLTTRTLEKSILEAHGFQVLLAVDGLDALRRLRAESVDLVIADVQMPHLDGFGLLETIKQDPLLGGLPVILVTSLESREDRQRGLSMGADAYIVKRRFDQSELLATIGQLL